MEILKADLNAFLARVCQIEFEFNNGEHLIDEYSRELIRRVQLAKEVKIQKLEQEIADVKRESDTMMKYIEINKKKLTAAYKANKNMSKQLASIKNNSLSKLANLKELALRIDDELLNSPNPNQISAFTYDLKYKHTQANSEQKHLDRVVFANNKLDIHSKKSSKLGLALKRTTGPSLLCFDQLDKLTNIHFNKYVNFSRHLSYFSTGELLLGFTSKNTTFLMIFTKNRSLKVTKCLKHKRFIDFLYTNDDKLALVQDNILKIFDTNLNTTASTDIGGKQLIVLGATRTGVILAAKFNENAYWSKKNLKSYRPIVVFDWTLEDIVKWVGQITDEKKPFYFNIDEDGVGQCELRNGFFYFMWCSQKDRGSILRIIDESTGKNVRKIQLCELCKFEITDSLIAVYNGKSRITFYDLQGIPIRETYLKGFRFKFNDINTCWYETVCLDQNGKLVFFGRKTMSLYFEQTLTEDEKMVNNEQSIASRRVDNVENLEGVRDEVPPKRFKAYEETAHADMSPLKNRRALCEKN